MTEPTREPRSLLSRKLELEHRLRRQSQVVLIPIVRVIARLGLTPNMLTVIGLLLSALVAVVLARGSLALGGVLLLLAASFDALDGTLARLTGRQSRFGAFFDSPLDRYSEAIFYGGLLFHFLQQEAQAEALLVYAAIIGSLMVSYARARAEGLGIDTIITVGIDLPSSRKAINFAALHDSVYATVGIHPHNVEDLDDTTYEELEELCAMPKVVAYGEIGLDYVKQYAPLEQQRQHFARQVDLAKKVKLPLVIHDREAHEDTLDTLRQMGPFPAGGVMHCFSGDWDFARKVLDLGFFISIPGVVTYNKADVLQEVARRVPLDRLLLETDAPFLTPAPWRGKKNLPEYVLYTGEKVAELKGISLAELAQATTANARNIFSLAAA